MQLKTILNRVQKFKSFVYAKVCRVDGPGGESAIEAELQPRRNSRPRCRSAGARRRAIPCVRIVVASTERVKTRDRGLS